MDDELEVLVDNFTEQITYHIELVNLREMQRNQQIEWALDQVVKKLLEDRKVKND